MGVLIFLTEGWSKGLAFSKDFSLLLRLYFLHGKVF